MRTRLENTSTLNPRLLACSINDANLGCRVGPAYKLHPINAQPGGLIDDPQPVVHGHPPMGTGRPAPGITMTAR